MSRSVFVVFTKAADGRDADSQSLQPAAAPGHHKELGLVRRLIDPSRGAKHIQLMHFIVEEGFEVESIRENQEELLYVIQGEAEVEFDGIRRRIGPGGTLFVPQNTPYRYKETKTPHEVLVVISPPDA